MLPRTTLAPLALAALLGTAGCSLETVERADAAPATAGAVVDPDAGQELHRMFEAEKRNAVIAELPAQF